MRVTILVDNYLTDVKSIRHRLRGEWGFAAYLHDLKILYDTGLSGDVLLHNMRELGIDPDEPDVLVLSHRHSDHTGGVLAFLKARRRPITVYAHRLIFERAAVRDSKGEVDISAPFDLPFLQRHGARLVAVEEPREILPGVYVSGEIPRRWGPSHVGGVSDLVRDDMALYISSGGLVALTGCGHSGVENIVEYGLQVTGAKRLRGVVGGLHFMGLQGDRVAEAARYLASKGPELVVGTHCTGVMGVAKLAEALGPAARVGGVGVEIDI
ncbi:MBL fold metallo-hydrolase [Pyrobaculum neutrophilum]|uniref:Beta-lactamase domain protein n=1 Tax=Pyrobaculum neutrophilum (strain DSM 2338 / JCM 9278 / NBRC 100436 / V24Sta) TaxID=444157 RepID=B1YC80_PYRNV|nr:MBL fold metallo-hydrolase [Pyrobaculum neutrophilum]ACB39393.1 beta-lactamase domain protein [Pyrobaculum neutrophilum V24Sta]